MHVNIEEWRPIDYKRRLEKELGKDFRSGVLLILYRVGLRVLWHSITTGGIRLTPPTQTPIYWSQVANKEEKKAGFKRAI